ncbi:MAG: single-stranded DNA-binding protein [Christensenellales bacterium]|nr:single-stranded DNA-binding protein [Christensenellales bacterium]
MNKVFLIGNLTRDPELSTTGSGVKFCRFTLAVSRSYSRDGKRETDFLPVVVWRAQADNCARYLKKGSKAAVSGSVQTRSYDTQDGSRRYVTEIAADEVQFLSTRNDDVKEDSVDFDDLTPIDDDLPF